MASYALDQLLTDENFDEDAYLASNNDVARAVKLGQIASGRQHFDAFGRTENRSIRLSSAIIRDAKHEKLKKLRPLLRSDMPCVETPTAYDFLSEELRSKFRIIDTDAVSSNGYDAYAVELINQCRDGLVLDCGAGKRPVYFDNVVNFEIADYDTTDVRGVGEVLPFKDNSFDAVLSLAVLEHVKDPFACAKEICRVLKPGGRLICCVPFLQPLHGYPNHYYNMTGQGLKNLFADELEIDDLTTYGSIGPIWSLTWILRSWADGLQGKDKEDFFRLTVGELTGRPETYLDRPFVKELSLEKNLEIASATALFAHKP